MRHLPLTTLAIASLLTAACGGGDKPAQTETADTTATAAGDTAAPPASPPAAPVAAPEAGPQSGPLNAPPAAPPAGEVSLASLTGDASKGERVFAQCKACHVVEPGVNRVGPSLHGVVGRKAGTVPGFNYSKANKDSGVTWTDAVLFDYLEAPQRFMPGTRMAFGGLKNAQDRADVIAFLKTKG